MIIMVKHLLSALLLTLVVVMPAAADDFRLYGTQYSPTSAIVAFAPTSPSDVSSVLSDDDGHLLQGTVAAFDGKKLYVYTPKSNSQTGSLYKLTFTTYTLDNGQWTLESSRQLSADYANYPNAMAYDPATDKLYGYRNGYPTTFYTIDCETGAMQQVASLYNYYYTSIAFDKDGTCYGLDFDCQLNRVDLAAATNTVIGATGLSFSDKQPTYIDAQTGTMYWVLTKTSTSALYTVDLSTGQATRVGDMGGEAVLSDIFGTGSSVKADEQTPDACTSLNVTYTSPGSLDATIKVTAPTLAFDKQTPLTADVSIDIYIDDATEPLTTLTNIKPGAEATAPVTFSTTGQHRIKAIAKNANGDSPAKTVTTYAGFDTPTAPANVTLSIDATGNYTLTWDAPTEGTHGGAIDQTALSYSITAYPQATLVGTTTATSFSGQIEAAAFASYSFGVSATAGTLTSEEARSNTATFGDYADLPYYDDFTDSSTYGLYTIVNTDGDATWTFGSGNLKKAAIYNGMNCSRTADDYLILPPMRMVEGVTYTLTFHAASAFNQDTGNHLDALLLQGTEGTTQLAKLGSEQNIADYTGGMTTFTYTYTAQADGAARVAFLCRSLAGKKLCLYDVYVTAQGYAEGPQDVSSLKVTPGAQGAHEATLTFTAPTLDAKGNKLESIDHIAIYRDDAHLATDKIRDVEPGSPCTWKDETVEAGTHTWRVAVYTDKGSSDGVSTTALVGQDIPGEVENLTLTEEDNDFLLTWKAPSYALNGGYIDYENLTYTVYYSYGLMENPEVYQEGIGECTLRVPKSLVDDYASAHQIVLTLLVLAETENGYSSPAYADLVYGKPYTLPFEESFAEGQVSTDPWTVTEVAGSYIQCWTMIKGTSSNRPMDVTPIDGDNGMAMYYHGGLNGYEARLLTPQVSIASAENPVLSLYVYHINSTAAATSTITVERKYPDTDDYETLLVIPVQGETGWQQHKIQLTPKDGAASDRFRLALRGQADNKQPIFVDALSIQDEDPAGITDLSDKGVKAYTQKGSIVVEGEGAGFIVFTTAGKQVARGTVSGHQVLSTAPGIYLVQMNGQTRKIIVK